MDAGRSPMHQRELSPQGTPMHSESFVTFVIFVFVCLRSRLQSIKRDAKARVCLIRSFAKTVYLILLFAKHAFAEKGFPNATSLVCFVRLFATPVSITQTTCLPKRFPHAKCLVCLIRLFAKPASIKQTKRQVAHLYGSSVCETGFNQTNESQNRTFV